VLVEFLHENRDIFAWQPSDMTGVPRELAEHALQIIPGSKLVRQAMRCFGDEKHRAIAKEISKLLKAGFIKEVIHTKWVANPVLVPKKNTKVLCMCVDYTGLIAETLIQRHVSGGKKVTSVKQCMRCESCPRRNYVLKFMADFYGMIQRIPEISLS
jgi:hypothetical protein